MYRMKKAITVLALIAASLVCAAQTAEEFKEKYERQVARLGYDGIGVETILDKWEAAFPTDGEMLAGRFNYYFAKSRASRMVAKPCDRYLGAAPLVTIPDSLGVNVNYFQEDFFDDETFSVAMDYIDDAVRNHPQELRYRYLLISALFSYGKEHPSMAYDELMNLLQLQKPGRTLWMYMGEVVDDDTFAVGMQEYCAQLFSTGGDECYGYFRTLSEKLSKMYPANSLFVTNLGSYWLVARGNYKKAISFYEKALKLNPEDAAAAANLRIARRKAAKK